MAAEPRVTSSDQPNALGERRGPPRHVRVRRSVSSRLLALMWASVAPLIHSSRRLSATKRVGLFGQPASCSRQRPILDSMRLFRCRAQPLFPIRFILRIIAIKPNDFAVAFECQNMGRDPIEKPAIVGNYHSAAGEIL